MNQRMYDTMDEHSTTSVLFMRNVVPVVFDMLADKIGEIGVGGVGAAQAAASLRCVAAQFRAGEVTKKFALAAANHAWIAFNYGAVDGGYAGLMVDALASIIDPTVTNREDWFTRAKDNAIKIIGHERMVLLLMPEAEIDTRLHDGIEYLNSLNGH